MRFSQEPQELVLGRVGVLVFIDHQIAKTLLVFFQDGGFSLQEMHCEHDQVVEVDRVKGLEGALIAWVDLRGQATVFVGKTRPEGLRRLQAVFGVGDQPQNPVGIYLLLPLAQAGADIANQPCLVGSTVDGKIFLKAELVDVFFENAHAQGMESRNHHAFAAMAADHLFSALFHFPGCFVGEGNRHNLRGRHLQGAEEMGDAAGDYTGFAGSGTGKQQQRSVDVADGTPLLIVKTRKRHRMNVARGKKIHKAG